MSEREKESASVRKKENKRRKRIKEERERKKVKRGRERVWRDWDVILIKENRKVEDARALDSVARWLYEWRTHAVSLIVDEKDVFVEFNHQKRS